MELRDKKQEIDSTESYWKYREMKSFYKLVHKSQNKHIPVETRKRIFQTISDLMIHSLPDDVEILDLFPNTEFGYSKKGEGVKNVWTFKEVNEYMDDLVLERNENVSERSLKRNRFFKRELDKEYKDNEKEEDRA